LTKIKNNPDFCKIKRHFSLVHFFGSFLWFISLHVQKMNWCKILLKITNKLRKGAILLYKKQNISTNQTAVNASLTNEYLRL